MTMLFLSTLLQITTNQPAGDTAVAGNEVGGQSVSILDLLMQGGLFIVPLVLLLMIAVYIIIERVMTIRKASKRPEKLMGNVKQLVLQGDIKGARGACKKNDSPVARMLEKGLGRIGRDLEVIEESIENVGKLEVYRLEKNLSALGTISGAAPMIGFLGTVTGMINAFIAIANEEGNVSPKLLSEGIYEAMVTTVGGLFVGIIAYIGYNVLTAMVQKAIHNMEYTTIEFLDLLQDPVEEE